MGKNIEVYESLINKILSNELNQKANSNSIYKEKLEPGTSGSIIASYIKMIVEKGLRHYKSDNDDLSKQIEITNKIIENLSVLVEESELEKYSLTEEYMLKAIGDKLAAKDNIKQWLPQTSVASSSLFTGAIHEPPVYAELKREIASADRIDLLVSFIKFSGLRLIYDDLKEHTKSKKLRVITTSYMGASDLKAIQELAKLQNTEVKVSYDTNRTRLHAKAYYFHRNTGFSTAYIGSSNLSQAALSEGTEWNMKVSEYTSAEIINKYRVTFETYWNLNEFQVFNPDNLLDVQKLKHALSNEKHEEKSNEYFFDLVPYAYQQEILDRLEIEREVYNSYYNLIVAATGTGKTMVSAFDFKNFYKDNPSAKLLFLAHREEILSQSVMAFRGVLKDANFGELWVGNHRPSIFNHVFASIQTLNSNEQYKEFACDYFDYIVLDESHHTTASSYRKILSHFEPKIMLGLTATPERLDGEDILEFFNHRIAYEIRLREAIERNLLCPFHYFGVSETVDLSNVKWQNGRYDTLELSDKYIGNLARDIGIVSAIDRYVTSRNSIKGLGFCVSKEHARYMANSFNEKGISSISLDSDSSDEVRRGAKDKLISGDIKFIFVVDLYNEGVDIPQINTVLFLRPTESATLFIQQLGRGLRLHESKDVLTVLDFIGQGRKEYNYQVKFQSMIGRLHHSIDKEINQDFPTLPKTCFIQLEKVARDIILDNISSSYCNKNKLKQMVNAFPLVCSLPFNLINFLEHYNLTPQVLYKASTLSELSSSYEASSSIFDNIKVLKSSFMKVSKINDYGWLNFLDEFLASPDKILLEKDKRRLLMLYYTMFQNEPEQDIVEVFQSMKQNKALYEELKDLVKYNLSKIDHLPNIINISDDVPLELHASYSTDQVLSALGVHTTDKKAPFREGVKYIEELNLDVFFITLNKSDKLFKESTMYEDYAINEELFHWQSQSRTTVNSSTGRRYINMKKNKSKVLLLVREEKSDSYGATETFKCLGLASYVSHEGSAPISIIYKLESKMPMNILRSSNQVVNI
ncbi:DUF3427 domain-containing protein [Acetoanaerobium noterae]|uniref:DUF3427 domain-containing protein n=1 Tax=Acetoanaerobium noterae TaxID=745369 RepID=UPI0028A61343|nr:DUF3427 domain-containing protein [Acetoanaerobium noterae]